MKVNENPDVKKMFSKKQQLVIWLLYVDRQLRQGKMLSPKHFSLWIQNKQTINIRAACLLSKEAWAVHIGAWKEWLATLIIRGLLIRLGRGLCFAHTYSCEGGTPVLHGTAYGHESGVIANEAQGGRQQGIPKTVYKSCALHLALCESPDKGWQELMPQFQRWCLNRQLRADTDDTTWPKPGLPFNSHCLNQEHIQSQLAMLLSKQQKVIVRTSLIVTVHHFSYNTWCEMKRRSCAPVCSTCSFLPSSLLVWAALPLLGNRLQDELLGFTPERQ